MREGTYYFEVSDNMCKRYPEEFTSKYAYVIVDKASRGTIDRIRHFQCSDRVWRQGPKGGVKIVKDRFDGCYSGYVTTNGELMKKFMWIKLRSERIV